MEIVKRLKANKTIAFWDMMEKVENENSYNKYMWLRELQPTEDKLQEQTWGIN